MLIGLAVRLLIPDTTAVSAWRALRQAGLPELVELRREVCWGCDVEDPAVADAVAGRLLTADVLVNHNKHRGRWWRGPLEAIGSPEAPGGNMRWGGLLVEERDDPEIPRMQALLGRRLGFVGIGIARHGTVWWAGLPVGGDVVGAMERAAELLLVNSHGQTARLVGSSRQPGAR
jgi:hypothetical protein